MDSLKLYIKTHYTHWYFYIGTLFLSVFSSKVTNMAKTTFIEFVGEGVLFYLIWSLTFALVATPLLIVPNFNVGVSRNDKGITLLYSTIVNQGISVCLFFVIRVIQLLFII